MTKKDLFYSFLFLAIIIGGVFIKKSCDKSYLKDSSFSKAKIIEKSGDTYAKFATLKLRYQLNDKTIYSHPTNQGECFNLYKVGDSVNIKYSIENPEITEIITSKQR